MTSASDPDAVTSWDGLRRGIAALRAASGHSYQRIAAVAVRSGHSISKSGVANLCTGDGRPTRESLAAFLHGCGVPAESRASWLRAWDRLSLPPPADTPSMSEILRRWTLQGTNARDHFERRSRGLLSYSRGGDLFRGRRHALAAARDWLTGPPPGRPLVITGQPGAGKSALLARACLHLARDTGQRGLYFHARGATYPDLFAALRTACAAAPDSSLDGLLETLDQAGSVLVIAVDALDEAAGRDDRRRIAELLREAAVLPTSRIAVATRPLVAPDRFAPGSLFALLGVPGAKSAALIDLDTDRYFEPAGLLLFAAAMLTQEGARHPGPPDAAWTAYRADPALTGRLARLIAARARRNYLVAAMAALSISVASRVVDPAAAGFNITDVPSTVGEALSKYLDNLPELHRQQIRTLLRALAYARGDGINDTLWLRFSAALGHPATELDLALLRDSAAADYLLHTVPERSGMLTRLFHQALNDELQAGRDERADEQSVFAALVPPDGWTAAGDYQLRYAADHAVAAGRTTQLLTDRDYLAHADLSRLLAVLPEPADTTDLERIVVLRAGAFRVAGHQPSARMKLLDLMAAHVGLPDVLSADAPGGHGAMTPHWAHALTISLHSIDAANRGVTAVAVGTVHGTDVIVAGGTDGTVRLWDAFAGQVILATQPADPDEPARPAALATCTTDNADVLVVATGYQIHVVDALTGRAGPTALIGQPSQITAITTGVAGDRPVVAAGDAHGRVRVLDLLDGALRYEYRTGTGAVEALATDGDQLLTMAGDGAVTVRELGTGRWLRAFRTGQHAAPAAIAVGRTGAQTLLAYTGPDGVVGLHDATTGQALDTYRMLGPGRALAFGPQRLYVAAGTTVAAFRL